MTKSINDIPVLNKIWSFISPLREQILLGFDSLYYAKKEFKHVFGREMNLKHPSNLIEKFYWIENHCDLSLMTLCSDKYLVRDFIKEKGVSELLTRLYAKWDSPDDISFVGLPNEFILKINNGSGDVVIIRDAKQANLGEIRKHFKPMMKETYGSYNGQKHYAGIRPCIIAEELLPLNGVDFSTSVVDYKFYCFDGKPESIFVCYNRTKEKVDFSLYDLNWNVLINAINPNNQHYIFRPEVTIPKPKGLQKMIEYASLLSEGFPEVRVDFYDIDGKVYFGELTFTSGYGFFTPEYYEYLGSKVILS